MRYLNIGVVVATSVFGAGHAVAACVAPFNFQITSQGPWQAVGRIKAGANCSGSFNSSSTLVFRRLYLASAPQRGTVRLREGGTYSYTAPAGYAGPDSFVLKVCGNQGGMDGCADIRYDMTVE